MDLWAGSLYTDFVRTLQTLKPGDRGTKKLLEHLGERLVCVRYREDPETGRRYKTAELIMNDALPVPAQAEQNPHEILALEIQYHETALREQVKAAGGRWDKEHLVWKLPRHRVNHLHLEERIVHR